MPFQFNDLSILIADDDPSIREITAAVLKKLEFKRIDLAENGEEAFKIFKEHNHSIVLTDWQMDPVDGLELIEMIRAKNTNSPNREVPVILATGFSKVEMLSEARDTGVTEIILKPYSADDLIKRIVYVLNRPRDFVDRNDYFGPDRRRRVDPEYKGPDRRNGGRDDE